MSPVNIVAADLELEDDVREDDFIPPPPPPGFDGIYLSPQSLGKRRTVLTLMQTPSSPSAVVATGEAGPPPLPNSAPPSARSTSSEGLTFSDIEEDIIPEPTEGAWRQSAGSLDQGPADSALPPLPPMPDFNELPPPPSDPIALFSALDSLPPMPEFSPLPPPPPLDF